MQVKVNLGFTFFSESFNHQEARKSLKIEWDPPISRDLSQRDHLWLAQYPHHSSCEKPTYDNVYQAHYLAHSGDQP